MGKKIIFVSCLVLALIITTGCGGSKNDDKEFTCSRTMEPTDGVKIDMNYDVKYTDDYVDEVVFTEKITSDDEEILEIYKDSMDELYSVYSDLEYYDATSEVSGNTLTTTVTINYAKIDTDKLIELDPTNATLIKNGKVSVEDYKAMYKQVGAECTK